MISYEVSREPNNPEEGEVLKINILTLNKAMREE